ncbi:MAG: ATP-binding cassette domain-containing protein [Acidimicrobiales bacterium]
MSAPLLALSGVRRHFGGVKAVDGVDLTVGEGEILGLIGPNGAGKTTLVNLITGHARVDAGTIRLTDAAGTSHDLANRVVHTVARRGVARTFQNLRLYGELTAIDNVVVGMHAHRRSDVLATIIPLGPGRRGQAERTDRACALLERVGLDPARQGQRAAATLAYGDQRRLEIARALALQPRLLLLDEPAAGMNAVEKDRLADLLHTLVAESDLTIMLIEHDLRLVMNLCSRVAVMDFGRKIADGPPAEVSADPAVVAAYLGAKAATKVAPDTAVGTVHPAPVSTAPHRPSGERLLDVEDLQVAYGAIEAVRGVSLHVDEGEVVTLIGANGAGKSTILRTLSGLVPSRGGRASFADVDLLHSRAPAIVAAGLIHVPEGREILGTLTVEENLSLGAWHRTDRAAIARDIEAQLERFPVLGQRRHLPAGQLSGGEQQVLAIGRALLARPRLLVLDEPSLGLAPRLAEEVFELVASLHQEGLTILLVEQNAVRALELASRGYVLETGQVSISGAAADLLADPRVQAAYLGT